MLSLSDDKRTGESAKSQRGLFPQKLLRNKLRIAVGNEIIKFQVGKFESSMKLAASFLPIPPAGPAAAAPKLAAPGRSEGLPDETEPGFRGKISIAQVRGTLSIGACILVLVSNPSKFQDPLQNGLKDPQLRAKIAC